MPATIGFWGGISCLLGNHIRSRGQARATADGWVSRCARCAIPMARAHGGGKWQAVKTPKRSKKESRAQASEVLAKAIVRSRKAARRAEVKSAKQDTGYIGDRLFEPDFDDESMPLATENKRRWFGLRKAVATDGKTKSRRRFLVFRRKAEVEEAALPEPLIAVESMPSKSKTRRKLFRGKRPDALENDLED